MTTTTEALQLARLHAMLTTEKHDYLPQTISDGAKFMPHQWVLSAIDAALAEAAPAAAQDAHHAEMEDSRLTPGNDWRLPYDVTVGCGTHRKGTSFNTLVTRMRMLHREAFGPMPTPEQQAANLAALQGAAPAAPQEPPIQLHPLTKNLVHRFSQALMEKLAAAEAKYGYSDGWTASDWMDECRAKLLEHVAKGDPRDVAAYCAFLWHHGERTSVAQPAQEPSAQTERERFDAWYAREFPDDLPHPHKAYMRAAWQAALAGAAPAAPQEPRTPAQALQDMADNAQELGLGYEPQAQPAQEPKKISALDWRPCYNCACDSTGKWTHSFGCPNDPATFKPAAQPAQEPLCMCKDRPASKCPGEWEPGCDLGNNPKFARAAPAAQTPLTLREKLQEDCVKMGLYWRASDAHGVDCTSEQAAGLLANALGVEVNIIAQPAQPAPERDELLAMLAFISTADVGGELFPVGPTDTEFAMDGNTVVRHVGPWWFLRWHGETFIDAVRAAMKAAAK
jgi:hypothetical protein